MPAKKKADTKKSPQKNKQAKKKVDETTHSQPEPVEQSIQSTQVPPREFVICNNRLTVQYDAQHTFVFLKERVKGEEHIILWIQRLGKEQPVLRTGMKVDVFKSTTSKKRTLKTLADEIIDKLGPTFNELDIKNLVLEAESHIGQLRITSKQHYLKKPERLDEIKIADIPYRVGRYVKFSGRVVSTVVGCGMEGEKSVKRLSLIVEGSEDSSRINVVYSPPEGEEEPAGLVVVEGLVDTVVADEKQRGDIPYAPVVYADKILTDVINPATYVLTENHKALLKDTFGNIPSDVPGWVDRQFAPHVFGRPHEKTLMLMVTLSPRELPLNRRKDEVFMLTGSGIGDPRETKDLLGKAIVDVCPVGGVHINSEVAKKTGLIAAVQRDNITGQWYIVWGRLSEADNGMAVLSGISSFPQEYLAEMRELLNDRKISVEKVVRGVKWARCRLWLTGNARLPMRDYPTRYHAMRDCGTGTNTPFVESADWLRNHIPIPFCESDVAIDVVDDGYIGEPQKSDVSDEIWRLLITDTWRRTLNDYDVESIKAILPELRDYHKALHREYGKILLAVTHKEGLKILTSLVMASAALHYRVNDAGKLVITNDDVTLIKDEISWLFTRLDIKKVKQRLDEENKQAVTLANELVDPSSDNDFDDDSFLIACEKYAKMLAYVGDNPMRRAEDIAKALQCSRSSLFSYKSLVERKLFDRNTPECFAHRKGFEMSPFGLKVLKHLTQTASPEYLAYSTGEDEVVPASEPKMKPADVTPPKEEKKQEHTKEPHSPYYKLKTVVTGECDGPCKSEGTELHYTDGNDLFFCKKCGETAEAAGC